MAKKHTKATKRSSKGTPAAPVEATTATEPIETMPTEPIQETTPPPEAVEPVSEPTPTAEVEPAAQATASEVEPTLATETVDAQTETTTPPEVVEPNVQETLPPETTSIEQAIGRTNPPEDCQEIYRQYLEYIQDKTDGFTTEFAKLVINGEVRLYLDGDRKLRDAPTAKVETTPAAKTAEPAAKTAPPEKPKTVSVGPKKLTALDAAAKVLAETGTPMNCTEMVEAMASKGYWTSPGGKTPAATLYSAILREIGTKGDKARFTKTERGKFAAKV